MGFIDKFKDKVNDFIEDDGGDECYDGDIMNPMFKGAKGEWHESNWEDEEWMEKYETIYTNIAEVLEDTRIKHDDENGVLELRGRLKDRPFRMKMSISSIDYPDAFDIEMKVTNIIDNILLWWDPEEIPKEKDEDEDWGDEDQEVRIFVEKAIYIEGDETEVNTILGNLEKLPKGLVVKLYSLMQTVPIYRFQILRYTESIEVDFDRNVLEMKDPVAKAREVIAFLGELIDAIEVTDKELAEQDTAEASGEHLAPSFERVSCNYCGSKYILAMRSNCPNCGAAYT